MTIVKTYCDHCGKELDDMKDYPDTDIGLLEYQKADFCQKCLEELETIIYDFVNKKEQ